MKITIVCVGKIKEKFYRDALAEYTKRLSRYCSLTIMEVADEKTKEQASETECAIIKDREGERILKSIRDDGYVIALAIDGKTLDSVELSEKIDKLGLSGKSNVYFVIGGSPFSVSAAPVLYSAQNAPNQKSLLSFFPFFIILSRYCFFYHFIQLTWLRGRFFDKKISAF